MGVVSTYVVNILGSELARRNARKRRKALVSGVVLLAFGVVFTGVGLYLAIATLGGRQWFAWLVQVFAGGLMIYFGRDSLLQARKLGQLPLDELKEAAFQLDRRGISMDMSRGPRLERRWGDFTLRRGSAKGLPVLHMRSAGMAPGDIQLSILDKSYEEIADAVRRLSGGKQLIED